MSGKHYFGFSLLLLFLAAVILTGQTPETQVSISISSNLAYIGDTINLKIIVKTSYDNIQEIKVHTEKDDFEIINQHPTEKRQQTGYTVFEKNITIAFFKVGNFEVGPFNIDLIEGEKVITSKKTNAVPINIKTVLKEDDKDIKPLKSLVKIKGHPWYMLKYALLAFIIIGLIIFFIVYSIKKRRAIPPPPKPLMSPLEELEFLLKELANKKLFEKGKIKLHFIELTQIFKRFINRTYEFNAEDFTTEETLYYLKREEKENLILNNARFVFNTADLVKFAKFVPNSSVLTEINQKVKELITQYKLRISLTPRPAEPNSTDRNPQAIVGGKK